jgi:hypothetical protein
MADLTCRPGCTENEPGDLPTAPPTAGPPAAPVE